MMKENTTSSSSLSNKTFYVENLGCSKNQVDAETIIAALKQAGWEYCDSPDRAELLIVNTCGFIQSAKEESIQTIFDYRKAYPDRKVLAAGCFAERYNEELLHMIPELDGVFGNKAPVKIADMIPGILGGEKPVYMPKADLTVPERKDFFNFKGSAFVKISEGCNNRCNFCAIPLIKGDLQSRSMDDILEEIKTLLNKGVFEINMVAQDLANYGLDKGKRVLIELLKQISTMKGDFWLRLLYIHPDHFPMEILQLLKDDSRFLPYFDIPFQHADKSILSRMGRKGDRETYLKLIETLRTDFPHGVIRSSIMCGFPGETKKSFAELRGFLIEAHLDWVGFFTYSREEGTEAYNYRGRLGTKLAAKKSGKQRSELEDLQQQITEEQMERFVGKELTLIIEEKVEGEVLYLSRSYFQAPEVDGLVVLRAEGLEAGDIVRARIIKRNGVDLEAVLVNPQ
ncbi:MULTISPECIES: 30S ribosomal protein S12 methylthiotransferase RimO [unclassified Oceanispirochaeta]|nr:MULTISPECIES: 30S ribosomal protein S12 methylthiotransferase RimO [unclassified Oceanispirochaeta]